MTKIRVSVIVSIPHCPTYKALATKRCFHIFKDIETFPHFLILSIFENVETAVYKNDLCVGEGVLFWGKTSCYHFVGTVF